MARIFSIWGAEGGAWSPVLPVNWETLASPLHPPPTIPVFPAPLQRSNTQGPPGETAEMVEG